jgi:hypothetical protein
MRNKKYLFASLITISLIVCSLVYGQEESEPVFSGRLLVKFQSDFPDWYPELIAMAFEMPVKDAIAEMGTLDLETPLPGYTELYAWMLEHLPGVEYAEPDVYFKPQIFIPNDPSSQPGNTGAWYLWRIGMPAAWLHTRGSPNVIIALLDTGVNPHPDLEGKLVPGWNFYDNTTNPTDVYGHGTLMAGIIAANTNNGIGIASVGTNCRLMPLRISDNAGNGGLGNAVRALVWAANRGAKVAVCNYEMYLSQSVRDAARYFTERGGIVIMPSGNSGGIASYSDNPYVLVVGATNQQDQVPSFVSRGTFLDLAAPGVDIGCTLHTGNYGSVTGTCPAAAVVGGVAGLIYSANPRLTPQQVEQILESTADDIGTPGWDAHSGWGRVNAYRAVVRARGLARDSIPPALAFISPTLNATVSGMVNITLNASDNVGIKELQVYIDNQLFEARERPPFTFRWDTVRVPNGVHTLSAVAMDWEGNRRTVSIPVTVSNAADTTPPTIRILSPTEGAQVSGTVAVLVEARDNQRVARVELYVNGQRVTLTTIAPFTLYWNTRDLAPGTYTLQCRAYDSAGNVGVSAPVTVRR